MAASEGKGMGKQNLQAGRRKKWAESNRRLYWGEEVREEGSK